MARYFNPLIETVWPFRLYKPLPVKLQSATKDEGVCSHGYVECITCKLPMKINVNDEKLPQGWHKGTSKPGHANMSNEGRIFERDDGHGAVWKLRGDTTWRAGLSALCGFGQELGIEHTLEAGMHAVDTALSKK